MMKECGDTLDFSTFLGFMEKSLKQPKQFKNPEIEEAFECFDPDGTGKIDKNQLKEILCNLGEGFTPKEWEVFLSAADPDNTGSIAFKDFITNVTAKKKDKDDD